MSQALGTGGHDLSETVGGISMLHGLAALDADPATKVIVLVSKPPAAEVAAAVLDAAGASAKPVVVIFLGADPSAVTRDGVYGAAYLAQAADMAVALAKGQAAARRGHRGAGARCAARLSEPRRGDGPGPAVRARASSPAARSASRRSWCTPPRASSAYSNTPIGGNPALERIGRARRTPSSTWATTSSPRAARTR